MTPLNVKQASAVLSLTLLSLLVDFCFFEVLFHHRVDILTALGFQPLSLRPTALLRSARTWRIRVRLPTWRSGGRQLPKVHAEGSSLARSGTARCQAAGGLCSSDGWENVWAGVPRINSGPLLVLIPDESAILEYKWFRSQLRLSRFRHQATE